MVAPLAGKQPLRGEFRRDLEGHRLAAAIPECLPMRDVDRQRSRPQLERGHPGRRLVDAIALDDILACWTAPADNVKEGRQFHDAGGGSQRARCTGDKPQRRARHSRCSYPPTTARLAEEPPANY